MTLDNKVIGGALLVSGTTIGAGMLALPVVTGLGGLIPTLCLLLIYWFYMTFTAFLMLEVNLFSGANTNLISMAKKTLGHWGEVVSWGFYLFLLYLLTAAYLAGSGPIVSDFIQTLVGITIPAWVGALPLLLIFGFFVYEGTRHVDVVNRLLMVGLAVSYIIMVVFIAGHVKPDFLTYINWQREILAVSLVATSFGFHIIIPTLSTYLQRDVKKLKKAILIGSVIPLGVYVIWEIVALGVIPLSAIESGYEKGSNGVHLLTAALRHSWVALLAQFFSFFAIVTSFLGVTLSLSDFLADGLKIKKTHTGRIILFALTFLPPLAFILTYPRAFISALEFAGAFGVVVLLGLMPALMAWSGRYRKKFPSPFTAPGGKVALLVVVLFSLVVIATELCNKTGISCKIFTLNNETL